MNDSSTGGYLAPAVDAPPAEDDELDDLVHDLVAGVTALAADLVRPRWQPVVAKQPEPGVNWCAFGIQTQTPDVSPAIVHNGANEGSDTYIRHQDLDVLCTFYGPAAKGYAQRLADGLALPQNREQLQLLDMAFVGVSEIRAAPDLVNQQWVRRYDITVKLRRKVTRTYAVLNLKSVQASTTTDASPPVTSTINVNL
ncbi:phage neck terminator protein [Burkholderia cepacia]|uniref:phage neck terminator protein n=1 Tax=Burkholderia cepacia TaxID=292 RepID=UPI003D676162